MKIPLIICGAFGRMGREVIDIAQTNNNFVIKALVVRSKVQTSYSDWPVYDSLEAALSDHAPALVIDFSVASLAKEHLAAAANFRAPFMLTTTGHGDNILDLATAAAKSSAILVAPNTSLLANLLIAFCKIASARLPLCDAGVIDIHHAAKKDAPSGTAKAIAKAITKANPQQTVDIVSLRKGNIAGEHTAYFFSENDRLELTHRISHRRVLAEGALVAAQFLFDRPPGLYDMNDVLNLNLIIEK